MTLVVVASMVSSTRLHRWYVGKFCTNYGGLCHLWLRVLIDVLLHRSTSLHLLGIPHPCGELDQVADVAVLVHVGIPWRSAESLRN